MIREISIVFPVQRELSELLSEKPEKRLKNPGDNSIITEKMFKEDDMRTYLVTGGAGFIGSNYIHYMFKKYDNEIRIINVDKLTYAGNLENLKDVENRDNYTFIKADI